jgi:hypothetical protein
MVYVLTIIISSIVGAIAGFIIAFLYINQLMTIIGKIRGIIP